MVGHGPERVQQVPRGHLLLERRPVFLIFPAVICAVVASHLRPETPPPHPHFALVLGATEANPIAVITSGGESSNHRHTESTGEYPWACGTTLTLTLCVCVIESFAFLKRGLRFL